jgi:hypothetical protein
MAAHWLDVFARRIQSDLSRRNALVLLAGALASGSAFPQPTLAGKCKKVGKKCDKNKDCCDGAKCKKETCKCKSGRTECGGKCHKLDKDKKHCGVCNNQCSGPELCLSSVCIDPAK